MQLSLPVSRDEASRSRHGLVKGMVAWRSQRRTVKKLLARVIPKPILTGLEALHDPMSAVGRMPAGMLGRRRVAAADVPTPRTALKVEPPTSGCEALEAACATGRCT